MKTAKAVVIAVGALILFIAVFCYGFVSPEGLSARKKPSKFEYAIANYALSLSIPRAAKAATSPLAATPEALMGAKKYYSDNCAVCHANDGTGKTDTAKGLSPEVPDLHAQHIQKLTDGEMFYIIRNGVRFTGMPGWDFRGDQIWNLVAQIRQFGNNSSPQPGKGPL